MKTIFTLVFTSMFLSVVHALTLEELVTQAQAAGHTNYIEIRDYLNEPQGYVTVASTNTVPKPTEQFDLEVAVLAQINSLGVDPVAAVTGGWPYIIAEMDIAFIAASGNDAQEKQILKASLMLLAVHEQLKTMTGESKMRPDFGNTNTIFEGAIRTPNPSLAQEHLGHQVTREELK